MRGIPEGFVVITPPTQMSPCPTCPHFNLGKDTDVNSRLADPCDTCQPLENYRAFIEGREPVDVVAARAAELAEMRKIWPTDPRWQNSKEYRLPKKYTNFCPFCREKFKSARKYRAHCDKPECIRQHKYNLSQKHKEVQLCGASSST
jgi:hypothetical protein